jgi:hypothetical protein
VFVQVKSVAVVSKEGSGLNIGLLKGTNPISRQIEEVEPSCWLRKTEKGGPNPLSPKIRREELYLLDGNVTFTEPDPPPCWTGLFEGG